MDQLTAYEVWQKAAQEGKLSRREMNEHLRRLCPENTILNKILAEPRGTDFSELLRRAASYEIGADAVMFLTLTNKKDAPLIPVSFVLLMKAREVFAKFVLIQNYERYTRK